MKYKIKIAGIGMIVFALIESLLAYSHLPERVASHWDATGHVNGYMGRFGGAFFLPLLLLGLFILFSIIPMIDPRKQNISKFRTSYDRFIIIFVIFMVYIHTLMLAFNLGHNFDLTRALLPSLGILFFAVGFIIEKAQPNWFIGIRTPWTLSNDVVWEKTHRLGGLLYKISGVIALLGFFVPTPVIFFFVISPIILSSLWLLVYSYLEFKKLEK